MNNKSKNAFLNYGLVIVFFVVFQALLSTGNISSLLKGLLVPMTAYMILAISLNLVVGISGELSLGHAGFMSIGAFTAAFVEGVILNNIKMEGPLSKNLGVQILIFVISVIVAAVFAAIAGFLIGIPVLRLNGDYLAIVTLAFGEIIKNIFNCIYISIDETGVHISDKNPSLDASFAGKMILEGPQGSVIKKVSIFAAGIILLLLVLIIVQNLVNSKAGRAIMAMRDNRIAAESSGLPIKKYKLMAFTISAAIAGAGGALFALNSTGITPKQFDFNASILILVFVVLGGIGNMTGSMIAAALLYILPEMLRELDVQKYRMLIYAVLLIAVMLLTNNEKIRALAGRVFKKKDKASVKPEAGKEA